VKQAAGPTIEFSFHTSFYATIITIISRV
jgi:hypothetical protein